MFQSCFEASNLITSSDIALPKSFIALSVAFLFAHNFLFSCLFFPFFRFYISPISNVNVHNKISSFFFSLSFFVFLVVLFTKRASPALIKRSPSTGMPCSSEPQTSGVVSWDFFSHQTRIDLSPIHLQSFPMTVHVMSHINFHVFCAIFVLGADWGIWNGE